MNGQEEPISRSFADRRILSGTELWLAQAREQFGDSAEYVRESGDVITSIREVAIRVAADLIVVGRTRPGTIGLGVQGHILKIDHAGRCPVLSLC
jgi:nucleotide-binding universal stress UspA family protein